MRTLFVHDGPLKVDENNQYYGIAHNDDMFRRYYTIAENLAVAIRTEKVNSGLARKKYSKITLDHLTVIPFPNISSIKGQVKDKQTAKKMMAHAVGKSDYIIIRLPSLLGFVALKEAKRRKKPYLIELVTCPWDSYRNHSQLGKIIAPLMYLKTKKGVKDSKYVVYVTNDFLQRRYPTNGKSTNCSNVVLTNFDEEVLEKRLKKISEKASNNKIIIGTTAAVNVKFKGQQYIIKALGELKKLGIDNYEYQLVGGGDTTYLEHVAKENGVSDQVKFLGSLPHKKVFDWLEKIDLYAQPSRQEGLPRALIEAMSKGMPSFGAKTAGIPELLENDFIFSNTDNNIDEICLILKKFNKETMLIQAKRNYEASKVYEKSIIENRREKFFMQFKHESTLINKK